MGRIKLMAIAGLVASAAMAGCSTQRATTGAQQQSEGSILASSVPNAGSSVRGPVNQLILNFDPPARLHEVTVTGPDGEMPTMVTAVGEVGHYSVPLSGLGEGAYEVAWRATAAGRDYRGRFRFTVSG